MGVMDDDLDQCEVKLSPETNTYRLSFSVERLLKCNKKELFQGRTSLNEVDEQNNSMILDYSCSNIKNCNERAKNLSQTVLRPTPIKILTNLNTQTAIISTSSLGVPLCRFQPNSSTSICPFFDGGSCFPSNLKTNLNDLEVYSQQISTTLPSVDESYNFHIPALLNANCTLRLPPSADGKWSLTTAGNSNDSNTDSVLVLPGTNSVNKSCPISLENSLRNDIIYKQNSNHGNSLISVHSSHNSKRKRSWSRAVFSNLQRKGLEIQFQQQKYITKPDRRKLAARLNLTDAQVKVWFQNRRMKWRHTRDNHQKTDQQHCNKMETNGTTSSIKNSNNSHIENSSSNEIGQILMTKVNSKQNSTAISSYLSDTSNSSCLDISETEAEDLEIDVVEL